MSTTDEQPVDARDVCAWTQDEWECDYWSTTCGEAYSFGCDPTEYKALRFCCYCGKHMKLVPFVLPADEAAAPSAVSEPAAPVDALDALKAIENINDLACFASEENTSIQAAVLLQIGQIARAALTR